MNWHIVPYVLVCEKQATRHGLEEQLRREIGKFVSKHRQVRFVKARSTIFEQMPTSTLKIGAYYNIYCWRTATF